MKLRKAGTLLPAFLFSAVREEKIHGGVHVGELESGFGDEESDSG
jgi:hypothetical protein